MFLEQHYKIWLIRLASLVLPMILGAEDQTSVAAGSVSSEQLVASLPDGFRQKVERYLEQEAKIGMEVIRLESMALAGAANAWAQRRADGMTVRLNSDLRQQRQLRQELFREYRSLLLSGWEPEVGSMDHLERLIMGSSAGN